MHTWHSVDIRLSRSVRWWMWCIGWFTLSVSCGWRNRSGRGFCVISSISWRKYIRLHNSLVIHKYYQFTKWSSCVFTLIKTSLPFIRSGKRYWIRTKSIRLGQNSMSLLGVWSRVIIVNWLMAKSWKLMRYWRLLFWRSM